MAIFLLACTAGLPFLAHAQEASGSKWISAVPAIQRAKWTRSWWMPRHNAKVARVRQGGVDLLMIGDSIMHGWENAGAHVWKQYYQHRRAVNLGFSGDRTEHVLWRLMNGELDGISPKLAILMIGTNNSGHGRASQDTAAGVKRIVQEIRDRLPQTDILLLAVFPRGPTPTSRSHKLNREVNRIIADYDDGQHIFFLNINKVFRNRQQNLSRTVMPDLLHPNAEGYRRWAEGMESVVHRLMGDQAGKSIEGRCPAPTMPTRAVARKHTAAMRSWHLAGIPVSPCGRNLGIKLSDDAIR